ncbi:MAG: helicase-exonuclease AddAB subunit AddA [Ruminococcaceae bacterium]|nr:helicase-exonuclease AddAB subunit AddA [Oscillospiraceae bacterium]
MPEWTPGQQNAINATGCNILVSAAAGSGKTAVLTQRVIRIITDEHNPVDIDRLLIVTFTNAAAAEMRGRISKALSELSVREPNNTNILRQISLLPSAKICTIDAFCISLVRENFFKLDIAQDFKILDNAEQKLIEDTAINDIIEEHYKTDSESFKALVELLCSTKNDRDLVEAVKRITSYISAQPFPENWLSMCCEQYNPDVKVEDSYFGRYVFQEVRDSAETALNMVDTAKDLLARDDELYDKYASMLEKDEDIFTALLRSAGDWDNLKTNSESIKFSSMPFKRGYTSPVKEQLAGIRDAYKDIIKSDILPLLASDTNEIQADNEYLYPIIRTLCEVVTEYSERMLDIKHEMNAYSFSDVERFAIELLFYLDENGAIARTDLAREFEDSFSEILVDEYQDTNAAQDTLFEMLSNGHNRFMVGDVKQSIYRFRLAMPEIFNRKKDEFAPYDAASDACSQKIILDRNFRSKKGICEFTNFLFSHLMSRKIGELDYEKDDYLNYGAKYEESGIPSAQLCLIETPEGEDADEYEARQAAQLILSKVKSGELVKEGEIYRKIQFSDFAVLFRSAKKRMPVWAKVFAEYHIPTTSNNRINLFDNNEVAILLSLLRTVDNPSRDVPLLATLMSVFYGYTAEQIAAAKIKQRGLNLYTSITADGEVFHRFLDDMELYRSYATSMSVENFIRRIVNDTSYLSLISAMGDGEQRRLNVMKFIELASVFDKGENVGLTAFIRFIDNIIQNGVDVDSAELVHTGASSVQLMSVHQSKGLEFPVCILASSSHKYNTEDLRDLVQLNNTCGIGLKVNNESGLYRYNSMQYSCVKNINADASMSENLRVLYVAITRAKEQFITFASYKDIASKVNKLAAKLAGGRIYPSTVKHLQSDGDMILLCALMHRDAAKLRALTEIDVPVDSVFDFDMKISFGSDIIATEHAETEAVLPNEELVKAIGDKLSFTYERSELSRISSKRSASELDERDSGFKFFAKTKPAFLDAEGMTATEKGSAMHAFMQYADFAKASSDIESEVARLLNRAFITPQQADVLDRDKLHAFFKSDIASRMLRSPRVYREYKLTSLVPACELEDTTLSDGILVQGIADCIFEEDGALVLVDYKTDFVKSSDELLDLYKKQLAFYKSAAEKALKMPVKQSLLYSFTLGCECVYK